MEIRIGEKIKQLRNLNNITQKQLANAIGCTEIMISRYELGIVNISISQIGKIAKHFNVAPGYFFEQNSESVNNTDNRVAKQVFIFDLDDTLVDGRQFCGETIARVITEKDPSQPFELICQLHDSIRGLTIEDLYSQITKELGLDLNISDLLKRDYEIQAENIDKMRLFDGVTDILNHLQQKGKRLFICTNRKNTLLNRVLRENKIEKYFEDVISCSDEGYKKPNPYCLLRLIDRLQVSKKETIYFGDSEVDSLFAQNAGIENIIFDQYLNNKTLFRKLINMFLI